MAIGAGQQVLHYRLIEKIGEGGMGVVWKAEDTRLQRHVALKFVPEESAGDAETVDRHLREARAASALNHPNICSIHDIGEWEGQRFIVMELLEGRPLELHIGSQPLEVEAAVDLTIEIADALAAAHAKGITHRDIKPANIFVVGDESAALRAKLLDFGLAKLAAGPASEPGDDATRTALAMTTPGSLMGTVAYMSPEQALGKELDPRTDIFSLGVVLYEMVTGRRAFEGGTSAAVFDAILNRPPTAPIELNGEVPAELERILNKALEKDPALRYQSAAGLCADLKRLRRDSSTDQGSVTLPAVSAGLGRRWLWVSGAVLAALALAAGLWLGKGTGTPEEPVDQARAVVKPAATSIAVLPFADMSPKKDQEYFSDGLSEELLNVLAKNRGLKVTGRTSSFQFRGKSKDLREIGEKLGVASILEGSVRKAGNQVRITAQLISVADGFHLWSETYDRELEDIFALQEEIAKSVAKALQVTLLGGEAGLSPQVIDPEAYTAYLQGRHFRGLGAGEENLEKAAAYLEQALQFAPEFAPAWAQLSLVRARQADQGYQQIDEGYARARKAAERALELDPNHADAYVALAEIKMLFDWDWQGASAAVQKGLELEPTNPAVLLGAVNLANSQSRGEEALELRRRMVALDPLSAGAYLGLGVSAYHLGLLDEAEKSLKKALELQPDRTFAHGRLGEVYLAQGEAEGALREMKQESSPAYQRYGLALAYHAAQQQGEADAKLAKLIESNQLHFAYQIAQVYAFRGESDAAFEWLERAYQQRDGGLADSLMLDPHLATLHGDPRWPVFLEKMGLLE